MWKNLAAAGERYAALGFRDFAQPWVASHEAIFATLPAGAIPTTLHGEDLLVGSAEQAFIDRMLEGNMAVGKWQATTPCFRREPVYDRLHRPYFMKLELINYLPGDPRLALEVMISQAQDTLRPLLHPSCPDIQVEKTEQGWDLTLRGQEIGSYGVRTHGRHQWVYGTGLAEPRFSMLSEGRF